jgi:hypothetical protein
MIGPWVAEVVYVHDRQAARTPIQPSRAFDLIRQASKAPFGKSLLLCILVV